MRKLLRMGGASVFFAAQQLSAESSPAPQLPLERVAGGYIGGARGAVVVPFGVRHVR